jgi:polyphosphate kinase 2 (PPK2 family)
VEKLIPKKDWRKAYRDIVNFERTIADDGYVLVKFWLHIDKKEQRRRFKLLEKDPLKSWQVTDEDWRHHKEYQSYITAVEEMLERTEAEWAPWTIVEATNRWWARTKVLNTIIEALTLRLEELGKLPAELIGEDDDFVETIELEAEAEAIESINQE